MTDNKKEVNFSASTTTTRAPRPNPKPSGKSVAQKHVDDSDEEGPTIQDIVDYQNIDIQQRLAHLTYADLENAAAYCSSSSSEVDLTEARLGIAKPDNANCCGANDHEVSEVFDDVKFRAKFMSKTMLIMASTLILPLIVSIYVLQRKPIRLYFIDGSTLHMIISGLCLIGLNIAVGRMRRGSGMMIKLITTIRSITLASTLIAVNSITEIIVVDLCYEPYVRLEDPLEDAYYYALKHPTYQKVGITTTAKTVTPTTKTKTKPTTEMHSIDRFVHTIPVLWIETLFVLFITWTIIGIVLRIINVEKVNPNGVWMFGLGCSLALILGIANFVVIMVVHFGSGPKLWDLNQVTIAAVIPIIESVWLPYRWRRLFRGNICDLGALDHVNIAARFSF